MSRPHSTDSTAPPERPASLEALYEAHADQVYVWALRYAKGRTAWAEDITHDVFLKAWQHRVWLREEDIRGWLFRVTQNQVFSALRKERTFRQRVSALWRGSNEEEVVKATDLTLEKKERRQSAMAVLNRLPGQERVVMALKLLDDLSQREISKLLSLSEGYVSKLISRAEARLREWEGRGGDDV